MGKTVGDVMALDQKLLDILACPLCKAPVELREQRLCCDHCGRSYRVEDDIPIMLIDEAELACPFCAGEIETDADKAICQSCGKQFPVEDGVAMTMRDRAIES